jgi:hypothetical protein
MQKIGCHDTVPQLEMQLVRMMLIAAAGMVSVEIFYSDTLIESVLVITR